MPDPQGVLARISVGLLDFVLPRRLRTTPKSSSGTLFGLHVYPVPQPRVQGTQYPGEWVREARSLPGDPDKKKGAFPDGKPLLPDGTGEKPETDYFCASSTATATATVAPTMGLLPIPMRPIIST